MKKVIENEITRGILIALLGVDTFITLCLGSYVFTDYGIGHIDVHPFATGILIIIGLALFAFIMRSAGHYKGSEEIEPNFFDRVPLEIYLAVDGGIILGLIGLLVYAIRLIFGFELIFFITPPTEPDLQPRQSTRHSAPRSRRKVRAGPNARWAGTGSPLSVQQGLSRPLPDTQNWVDVRQSPATKATSPTSSRLHWG